MSSAIRRAITIGVILLAASVVSAYTVLITFGRVAHDLQRGTLDSLRIGRLERSMEQVARILGDSVLTKAVARQVIQREIQSKLDRINIDKQMRALRRDQRKVMEWVLERPPQPQRQKILDDLTGRDSVAKKP
jgi:hypothetical protein